jgi:hypothetical protein
MIDRGTLDTHNTQKVAFLAPYGHFNKKWRGCTSTNTFNTSYVYNNIVNKQQHKKGKFCLKK